MKFSLAVASLFPLVAAFHIPAPIQRHQNNLLRHQPVHHGIRLSAGSSVEDDAEEKDEDIKDAEESAALKWAEEQKAEIAEEAETADKSDKKKYVVVGAGWGGWGAAKALCESGIDADITIIDALPDPTGATPYLSKTGKPVEAGTRGFWKDYPNICELLAELGIQVRFFSVHVDESTKITGESLTLAYFFVPNRKTMSLRRSQTLLSTPPMVSRLQLPSFPM